ncbi:hypothetical protein ACFY1P_19830 [Streptomyces sp. NPDC001407]|uniref:hypothetical protein n=1 Tax=Streptomyces sp. NPDC001407 TaxID=3364573 RepID=UPI0036A90BDD
MPEIAEALAPRSYSQLELRLLRRSSFTAAYLPQVIDFVVRDVTGSEFKCPSDHEAAQIHRRLVQYAANCQPGAHELARTMLDVRHAVDLVRHRHYRATSVPGDERDTVVSATQVLELAVAAGRERVLRAQGGALVVAEDEIRSTVYRPVSEAEARAVQIAARSTNEETVRLRGRVVEVLAPHVLMADWSRDEGYGVAVDVVEETVSVQWWPAALPGTRALWEHGGIRQLCKSLLSASFTTIEADGGVLHIPGVAYRDSCV